MAANKIVTDFLNGISQETWTRYIVAIHEGLPIADAHRKFVAEFGMNINYKTFVKRIDDPSPRVVGKPRLYTDEMYKRAYELRVKGMSFIHVHQQMRREGYRNLSPTLVRNCYRRYLISHPDAEKATSLYYYTDTIAEIIRVLRKKKYAYSHICRVLRERHNTKLDEDQAKYVMAKWRERRRKEQLRAILESQEGEHDVRQ